MTILSIFFVGIGAEIFDRRKMIKNNLRNLELVDRHGLEKFNESCDDISLDAAFECQLELASINIYSNGNFSGTLSICAINIDNYNDILALDKTVILTAMKKKLTSKI